MRLANLEELEGNEILARTIYDASGRALLSEGITLKLSYLNRLDEIGINAVYIEDAISEGIEINDVICTETRLKANMLIKQQSKKFLKTNNIDVVELEKMTYEIINDVLNSETDLINLKDLRIKDEYTFAHSVNVCVLSVFLLSRIGVDCDRIKSVAEGCLMHDLGKILIPSEILNKPGKLTNEEFEEIKKHPLYGYKALKDDNCIRPITKIVVLMHHERLNGSGYPNALKGKQIHPSAQVCSICDVFDAMTTRRPYRKALSFADAIEFLTSTKGIYFDENYVDEFLKYIAIYPPGCIVLLNNGAIGIILECNKNNITRPVVRLLYNPKTGIKYKHYVVDMMEDLTLKIVEEIEFNKDEFNNLTVIH